MCVHEQMFQIAILLFKRTPVQNYFEIHAYMYGPQKLIYVTFKCDLDLQPT